MGGDLPGERGVGRQAAAEPYDAEEPLAAAALVEAAWAAGRTKESSLGAQYRRLAARRGKKRALLAVGHSLLVIFDHMLQSDAEYQDLGVEYFDHLEPERLRRYLVQRLERLGYRVTLTTQDEAS
jgi:hypothetical protein